MPDRDTAERSVDLSGMNGISLPSEALFNHACRLRLAKNLWNVVGNASAVFGVRIKIHLREMGGEVICRVLRPYSMKLASIVLFLFAFVVGCSTRSLLVGGVSRPIREASTEEIRVIEIARASVAAREGANGRSWADRATYDVRRQASGWSVYVLKTKRDLFGRPRGYPVHSDRKITIDEEGRVTSYR